MILVISNDVQEAYAFGIHELNVQSSSIETMDRLESIPPYVREVFVHYLPSGILRSDLHHLADILREAERDRILVHHENHDDWVWERAQLQPQAEPPAAPADNQALQALSRAALEILRLEKRVERLQRAAARYRAELADVDDWSEATYPSFFGGAGTMADEDTTQWVDKATGDPLTIVPNDSDRGADEVEGRGLTGRYDKGGDLVAGTTTVVNDGGVLTPLEQLDEEQKLIADDPKALRDDLKARAKELGIRVTSQGNDRLREQIAEAEAAKARVDLDGPPF